MPGEVRYFMPDGWKSKGDMAQDIIESYRQWEGRDPTQQEINNLINLNVGNYEDGTMWGAENPAPANVYSPEGEMIERQGDHPPMSDLGGGQGADTLMGGRKGYANPVSGTWAAKSSSPFGASRDLGRRLHAGNDLQAPNGSAAVASIGGKVIYAGHNQGYQWNAIVLGDDGNAYRYATHGPLTVKPGQRVEQGQPVGTIARNHLHFEVIPPGPTLNKMVAAAEKNSFVSTTWRPGQQPTTEDPSSFFDMDRGEEIHAGDVFGETQMAEVPEGSPALGARLAAEAEVPPSFPGVEETVALLAERGYTGPDAMMRFQADQMGVAGEGGRTSPEFFAALTNPRDIGPTPRPDRGLQDTLVAQAPGPITTAARVGGPDAGVPTPPGRPTWAPGDATMDSQKPPDLVGSQFNVASAAAPPITRNPAQPGRGPQMRGDLGAPGPALAGGMSTRMGGPPKPAEVAGLPSPRTRPPGLTGGPDVAADYRRLRLGDRGDDVSRVQSQLMAAGFNPGPVDGNYGPKTAAAVLGFQRAAEEQKPGWVGGKLDAIAGPYTQSALYDVTQNSAMATLKDPGGVPTGSPTPTEFARGEGLGRSTLGRPPQMSFLGGSDKTGIRPPGTVPATDRPIVTSGDRSINQSLAGGVRPMEAKPWNPWGGMGVKGVTTTPLTDPKNVSLDAGMYFSEHPEGSNEPAPMSPISMIGGMGGTGTSGLGVAGPGGPGPGADMSGGTTFSYEDEDEETGGVSGYNESFSQTGWL